LQRNFSKEDEKLFGPWFGQQGDRPLGRGAQGLTFLGDNPDITPAYGLAGTGGHDRGSGDQPAFAGRFEVVDFILR